MSNGKNGKGTRQNAELSENTDRQYAPQQPYTTLYVVRHGETEWNVRDILQGQKDSPLTERGIQQAKELTEDLADVRFDAVFSSDLLRARRTAEIFNTERKLAYKTSQLLRERNWGRYDGRKASIFRKEARQLIDKFWKLSLDEQWKFKYAPDIESWEEVFGRFMSFLREVAIAYPGKTILVVTHMDVLRTLLLHLGKRPESIDNMAYVIIKTDGTNIHLEEAVGLRLKDF